MGLFAASIKLDYRTGKLDLDVSLAGASANTDGLGETQIYNTEGEVVGTISVGDNLRLAASNSAIQPMFARAFALGMEPTITQDGEEARYFIDIPAGYGDVLVSAAIDPALLTVFDPSGNEYPLYAMSDSEEAGNSEYNALISSDGNNVLFALRESGKWTVAGGDSNFDILVYEVLPLPGISKLTYDSDAKSIGYALECLDPDESYILTLGISRQNGSGHLSDYYDIYSEVITGVSEVADGYDLGAVLTGLSEALNTGEYYV